MSDQLFNRSDSFRVYSLSSYARSKSHPKYSLMLIRAKKVLKVSKRKVRGLDRGHASSLG